MGGRRLSKPEAVFHFQAAKLLQFYALAWDRFVGDYGHFLLYNTNPPALTFHWKRQIYRSKPFP